ncbi:MAG: methyl-accepting chemotaxis protein, partial [Lachnospiraceae bacterium]|nr:methyl-accepting chemotaxis protein [Lachnospiraceae bacterium]
MMKRKTRGIGIRAKILFPTSMAIILLCAVMGFNSYQRTKEGLVEMGVEEAQMAAVISTKVIDAELVAEMSAETQNSEEVNALLQTMLELKQSCGIQYLYTLYTDGSRVYYGIDADNTDRKNAYGAVFESSYQELKSVFDGNMYVQDYIDSTADGDLISAYMPLKDTSGKVVAIVGCDYDASGVVARLQMALTRVIQIAVIFMIIALVVFNLMVVKVIRRLSKVYD